MSKNAAVARAGALFTLLWGAHVHAAPSLSYEIVRINLTGPGYEKAGTTMSSATLINTRGMVLGESRRYAPDGTTRGYDVWLFDGLVTRSIGLSGAEYERPLAGLNERDSNAFDINEHGWVVGQTQHYDASGMSRGNDAWVFDGVTTTRIGPVGDPYHGVLSNGSVVRNSYAYKVNEGGIIIGASSRYAPTGQNRGLDPWYYDGTEAVPVNLTGAPYERVVSGSIERVGYAQFLNEAGTMVGETLRRSPSGLGRGRDVWVYAGAGVPSVINPVGGDYEWSNAGTIERTGVSLRLTEAGHVCGWSGRYSATSGLSGFDSWYYDGVSTRIVNPVGGVYEAPAASGTIRYGYAHVTNAAGQMAGEARRYADADGTQAGSDAWIFDGQNTKIIHPQSTEHEYHTGSTLVRFSEVASINAAGQVAGTANRFTPSGVSRGTDAWMYDGTSTVLIGLTGQGYDLFSGDIPSRTAEVNSIADSGHVGGFTIRRDANGIARGQTAWVYSPITEQTSPIELSIRSTDQHAFSEIAIMSESGAALGRYSLFALNGSSLGVRAFMWSEIDGAYDLGELIDGGLSAAGWESLATIADNTVPGALGTSFAGGPAYILGQGRFLGETAEGSVFLLRAVPSTGPVGLFGVCAFLSAPRRRRAALTAVA